MSRQFDVASVSVYDIPAALNESAEYVNVGSYPSGPYINAQGPSYHFSRSFDPQSQLRLPPINVSQGFDTLKIYGHQGSQPFEEGSQSFNFVPWSEDRFQKAAQAISTGTRDGRPIVPTLTQADVPDYQLGKEIGRGGFGRVYHATKDGQEYAIKIVSLQEPGQREAFENEVKILSYLSQPRCRLDLLCFEDAYVLNENAIIITKYIPGSSIDKVEGLSMGQLAKIFQQIAHSVFEIHNADIAHNDIKPDNIRYSNGKVYLTNFGVAKPVGRTYLTDFGIACPVTVSLAHELGVAECDPTLIIGTPPYMSPQTVIGQNVDRFASDVWALGVTFYELLSGELPFIGKNIAELFRNIQMDRPKRLPRDVPPQMAGLVYQMLDKDFVNRPNIRDVIVKLNNIILDPEIV